ncbi:hypothetical protein ACGYQ5_14280 [Burkholderia pseudomallei]
MKMPIPEPYREYAESMIDAARSTFEKHGELTPIAVIGDTNRNFVCPVAGLAAMPPSVAVQVLRSLAAKEHADFVMLGVEIYAARANSIEDAHERMAKYESVADMPDTIRAVFISLETYFGTWAAIAPREGTEGHYTFGEVNLEHTESNPSPFRDMLPRRASDTLQ